MVKFFTNQGYTGGRSGASSSRHGYHAADQTRPSVRVPPSEMAKKDSIFSFTRSVRAFQQNVTQAGPAAGASYTLIGAILVLGGLGYAIDRWAGTAPWGVAGGLLLGMVVGFYELIKSTWR
jgi:F0F1-type ATP synthase assembly protein I